MPPQCPRAQCAASSVRLGAPSCFWRRSIRPSAIGDGADAHDGPVRILRGRASRPRPGLQGSAQSLDPRNPTPLQPGENHGTIDNQTGAQYWALHYNPGAANIAVRFTSMGIFGNPMSATVNVLVLGRGGKMIGHQTLTSTGQPAQLQ